MKETGRKDDDKQTLASKRDANVNHQEALHWVIRLHGIS